MEEWNFRMRALKEQERRRKNETEQILHSYRGDVKEEYKRLARLRKEDREKHRAAEEMLRNYRGYNDEEKSPKTNKKGAVDPQSLPPLHRNEVVDPLQFLTPGHVMEKAAEFSYHGNESAQFFVMMNGSGSTYSENGRSIQLPAVSYTSEDSADQPQFAHVVSPTDDDGYPPPSGQHQNARVFFPEANPLPKENGVKPARVSEEHSIPQSPRANELDGPVSEPDIVSAEVRTIHTIFDSMAETTINGDEQVQLSDSTPEFPAQSVERDVAAQQQRSLANDGVEAAPTENQFASSNATSSSQQLLAKQVPLSLMRADPKDLDSRQFHEETNKSKPSVVSPSSDLSAAPQPRAVPNGTAAPMRLDVIFSFGLITATDQPELEGYMMAVEHVVRSELVQSDALLDRVRFDIRYRPYITDCQWDDLYRDPGGRAFVKRVLVTAAVPLFIVSHRIPVASVRSHITASLQESIQSGDFLLLAKSAVAALTSSDFVVSDTEDDEASD